MYMLSIKTMLFFQISPGAQPGHMIFRAKGPEPDCPFFVILHCMGDKNSSFSPRILVFFPSVTAGGVETVWWRDSSFRVFCVGVIVQ